MTWHNFDIDTLGRWMLPPFMRRVNTVIFIKVLLSPLEWLKAEILYRMQHDCRVVYMEKVLNEKARVTGYDPNDHIATRRIFIDEGNVPEGVWLNTSQNPDKIWLGTQYINTSAYYDANYSDFIVYVPLIHMPKELRIRRLIDYYKLAGKAYKIQYY